MANCSKLFLDFNKSLNLTYTKKNNIRTSRDNIKEAIKDHFKEKHPEYEPHFWIQGSYKMNTVIRYKDDTCDIDYGIYFFKKPDITSTTLQTWVLNAVEDLNTEIAPRHKEKCIRVIYKKDYHVDLPIYYKLDKNNDSEHPKLAVKHNEFELSDPKDFINWFRDEKDSDGQLIRIIKYLKSWGDNVRNKMPSGLAFTLLACECIKYKKREDIALRETLKSIKNRFENNKWTLRMPTCPYDDLFADYDQNKKDYILDQLGSIILDANEATENESNQLKASKCWKKHFGKYFPEGEDEDVDKKQKALNEKAQILGTSPYINKYGNISDEDTGKAVPDTKNYGGCIWGIKKDE